MPREFVTWLDVFADSGDSGDAFVDSGDAYVDSLPSSLPRVISWAATASRRYITATNLYQIKT